MNIETANKLLQYRKKSGLSQEELASKIGVSRQAVSKWERAEASPDTDNLILLSKVYGVTLDELLTGNPEEILNNKEEQSEDNNSANNFESTCETTQNETENNEKEKDVSFKNGIHVFDGKDKVDISFKDGIHVESKDGAKVHIDGNGINVIDEQGNQKAYTDADGRVHYDKDHHNRKKNIAMEFPIWLVSIIAFFLFGFLNILGGWSTSWMWFFVIPLYYTTVKAIQCKKLKYFCYPVFITWLYMFVGMYFSLWHPFWLLFITIPIFYYIAGIVDKDDTPKEDINFQQDGYNVTVSNPTPEKNSHKGRNVLLTISIIVVSLFLICCITYAFGDRGSYNKKYKLQDKYTDEITFNNGSGEVNFHKSNKSYSYVDYKCNYKGFFGDVDAGPTISYNGGSTNITTNTNNGFAVFGYFRETTDVYLIDKDYKKLRFNSSSGSVKCEDDFKVQNLDVEISSGYGDIENIQSESINMNLSSGSIDCDNLKSDKCNIEVKSGEFEVQGDFQDTKIKVYSGSATINSKSVPKYSSIDVSSGSVDYIIPDTEEGFTCEYERGSGDIDSEFNMNNSLDGSNGISVYRKGVNKISINVSSGSVDILKSE